MKLQDILPVTMVGDKRESIPYKFVASGAISRGNIVHVNGRQAGSKRPTVARADADSWATSKGMLWVAMQAATDGADVEVERVALLTGVNTATGTALNPVWLSGSAGGWALDPSPAQIPVGLILHVHASEGVVLLCPQERINPSIFANVIFRSTSTLSSAQLLALRATPQTLVTAPGAGRYLDFVEATFFHDRGAAAYTITAGGDDLGLRFGNGAGTLIATLDSGGLLDSGADVTRILKAASVAPNVAQTGVVVENQGIVLHNIGANEWTLGDGTLTIETCYRVKMLNPLSP